MPSGVREVASRSTRLAERPLLPRRERIFVNAAPSTPETAENANASMESPNNATAMRSSQSSKGFEVEATGLVRGARSAVWSVAGRVAVDVGRDMRGGLRSCVVFAASGFLTTGFGFAATRVTVLGALATTVCVGGRTTTTGCSITCVGVRAGGLTPTRAARVFFGTAFAAGTEGVGAGSAGGGSFSVFGCASGGGGADGSVAVGSVVVGVAGSCATGCTGGT